MTSLADLVCNSGSLGVGCCHGIHWFTGGCEDIDEARKSAANDPEHNREIDEDGVAWGLLDGRQMVYGCPKCMEKFDQIEQFILRNEEVVRTYLKAVGQERIDEATRLASI